jgi:ubiquitin thioesterase protein OTUB1
MKLIEEQQNMIRKEIEDESPLIGDDQPLELLQVEYSGNEPFIIKIHQMGKTYAHYRKTRRDGSCFYRAFLYRAFEVIISKDDKKLKEKLIAKLKGAEPFLKQAGFEGLVFGDVQDLFISKL